MLNLNAKIIGNPEPRITWFCNCRKITANEKFLLLTEEHYYTLIVKDIENNDEGEYTCKAVNVKGEASWSANMYINDLLKKPQDKSYMAPNFIRKIKDSVVLEGTATFDCFIDGMSFPKVTCFKNNSQIDIENNPNKYKLEVDETTGKVYFQIKNCDSSDETDYLIKIENEAGSSQCSATLTVEKVEPVKKNKRKVRFILPTDSDVFLIKPVNQIPLPPSDPQISNYLSTSLTLTWYASPSDTRDYTKELAEVKTVGDQKDEDLEVTYTIEFRSSKSVIKRDPCLFYNWRNNISYKNINK